MATVRFQPFVRLARNVSIAVGDLNNDGIDDWVLANEMNDLLGVEFGDSVLAGGDRQLHAVQRRDADNRAESGLGPGRR